MLGSEKIIIKTPGEVEIMKEGGKKLASVKKGLEKFVKEGVTGLQIEELANELIEKEGAESSFKKVKGYHWSTCVNVNDGIVHGIPRKDLVVKKGDVVSVDVGVFYKGFHTDTSFTKGVGVSDSTKKFLDIGRNALKMAMKEAKAGNRIYDISNAIEKTLKAGKLTPVRVLVGHGVGRELHEPPQIYCYTFGNRENSPEIPEGAVLAIEVMYTAGSPDLVLEKDGWTISTSDGKISGLFEDTVAVTKNGPLVLTD